MVKVVFQSVFCLEMYQNNILKKKIIIDINTSKRSKNTKKVIWNKKKIKIFENSSSTNHEVLSL